MGNAPHKTAEYSQLMEDHHKKPSPKDELTFCLEPVGLCRSAFIQRVALPGSVTIKIYESHAELWSTCTFNTKNAEEPIERWALCNIASWGHTPKALRLAIVTANGNRSVYDFKTNQGEQVTSALKEFSDAMVQTLRQAKLSKALQQSLASSSSSGSKADAINAPTDQLVIDSPADSVTCVDVLTVSMNDERTISKEQSLKAPTDQRAFRVAVEAAGAHIFGDHRPAIEHAEPVLLRRNSAMAA